MPVSGPLSFCLFKEQLSKGCQLKLVSWSKSELWLIVGGTPLLASRKTLSTTGHVKKKKHFDLAPFQSVYPFSLLKMFSFSYFHFSALSFSLIFFFVIRLCFGVFHINTYSIQAPQVLDFVFISPRLVVDDCVLLVDATRLETKNKQTQNINSADAVEDFTWKFDL